MLAAHVEGLDERFVDRKQFILKLPEAKELPVSSVWSYAGNKWGDAAYVRGNTRFGYVLEHQGDPSRIIVKPEWRLFDINKAYGVGGFKQEVWGRIVEGNREFVERLHTYDTSLARVADWNSDNLTLVVQPALYSDQVVSNHPFAHNQVVPGRSATVKETAFTDNGRLKPFRESPLANTIGVACVVRTCDDRWIIGLRSERLAIDGGTWSCPVSGAVEWRERGAWDCWKILDWIGRSALLECEQELGIEVAPECFKYLGFARELRRLGKPQIFFLSICSVPRMVCQKGKFDPPGRCTPWTSRSPISRCSRRTQ